LYLVITMGVLLLIVALAALPLAAASIAIWRPLNPNLNPPDYWFPLQNNYNDANNNGTLNGQLSSFINFTSNYPLMSGAAALNLQATAAANVTLPSLYYPSFTASLFYQAHTPKFDTLPIFHLLTLTNNYLAYNGLNWTTPLRVGNYYYFLMDGQCTQVWEFDQSYGGVTDDVFSWPLSLCNNATQSLVSPAPFGAASGAYWDLIIWLSNPLVKTQYQYVYAQSDLLLPNACAKNKRCALCVPGTSGPSTCAACAIGWDNPAGNCNVPVCVTNDPHITKSSCSCNGTFFSSVYGQGGQGGVIPATCDSWCNPLIETYLPGQNTCGPLVGSIWKQLGTTTPTPVFRFPMQRSSADVYNWATANFPMYDFDWQTLRIGGALGATFYAAQSVNFGDLKPLSVVSLPATLPSWTVSFWTEVNADQDFNAAWPAYANDPVVIPCSDNTNDTWGGVATFGSPTAIARLAFSSIYQAGLKSTSEIAPEVFVQGGGAFVTLTDPNPPRVGPYKLASTYAGAFGATPNYLQHPNIARYVVTYDQPSSQLCFYVWSYTYQGYLESTRPWPLSSCAAVTGNMALSGSIGFSTWIAGGRYNDIRQTCLQNTFWDIIGWNKSLSSSEISTIYLDKTLTHATYQCQDEPENCYGCVPLGSKYYCPSCRPGWSGPQCNIPSTTALTPIGRCSGTNYSASYGQDIQYAAAAKPPECNSTCINGAVAPAVTGSYCRCTPGWSGAACTATAWNDPNMNWLVMDPSTPKPVLRLPLITDLVDITGVSSVGQIPYFTPSNFVTINTTGTLGVIPALEFSSQEVLLLKLPPSLSAEGTSTTKHSTTFSFWWQAVSSDHGQTMLFSDAEFATGGTAYEFATLQVAATYYWEKQFDQNHSPPAPDIFAYPNLIQIRSGYIYHDVFVWDNSAGSIGTMTHYYWEYDPLTGELTDRNPWPASYSSNTYYTPLNSLMLHTITPLAIGVYGGYGHTRFWDVAFWDRVLSPQQLLAMYPALSQKRNPPFQPLVANPRTPQIWLPLQGDTGEAFYRFRVVSQISAKTVSYSTIGPLGKFNTSQETGGGFSANTGATENLAVYDIYGNGNLPLGTLTSETTKLHNQDTIISFWYQHAMPGQQSLFQQAYCDQNDASIDAFNRNLYCTPGVTNYNNIDITGLQSETGALYTGISPKVGYFYRFIFINTNDRGAGSPPRTCLYVIEYHPTGMRTETTLNEKCFHQYDSSGNDLGSQYRFWGLPSFYLGPNVFDFMYWTGNYNNMFDYGNWQNTLNNVLYIYANSGLTDSISPCVWATQNGCFGCTPVDLIDYTCVGCAAHRFGSECFADDPCDYTPQLAACTHLRANNIYHQTYLPLKDTIGEPYARFPFQNTTTELVAAHSMSYSISGSNAAMPSTFTYNNITSVANGVAPYFGYNYVPYAGNGMLLHGIPLATDFTFGGALTLSWWESGGDPGVALRKTGKKSDWQFGSTDIDNWSYSWQSAQICLQHTFNSGLATPPYSLVDYNQCWQAPGRNPQYVYHIVIQNFNQQLCVNIWEIDPTTGYSTYSSQTWPFTLCEANFQYIQVGYETLTTYIVGGGQNIWDVIFYSGYNGDARIYNASIYQRVCDSIDPHFCVNGAQAWNGTACNCVCSSSDWFGEACEMRNDKPVYIHPMSVTPVNRYPLVSDFADTQPPYAYNSNTGVFAPSAPANQYPFAGSISFQTPGPLGTWYGISNGGSGSQINLGYPQYLYDSGRVSLPSGYYNHITVGFWFRVLNETQRTDLMFTDGTSYVLYVQGGSVYVTTLALQSWTLIQYDAGGNYVTYKLFDTVIDQYTWYYITMAQYRDQTCKSWSWNPAGTGAGGYMTCDSNQYVGVENAQYTLWAFDLGTGMMIQSYTTSGFGSGSLMATSTTPASPYAASNWPQPMILGYSPWHYWQVNANSANLWVGDVAVWADSHRNQFMYNWPALTTVDPCTQSTQNCIGCGPGGDTFICATCHAGYGGHNCTCNIASGNIAAETCNCTHGFFDPVAGRDHLYNIPTVHCTNSCVNGVVYSDQPGHWACFCHHGWDHPACDHEVDYAEIYGNPCQHNSTYHHTGPLRYTCDCKTATAHGGYTGTNCETALNPCLDNPLICNTTSQYCTNPEATYFLCIPAACYLKPCHNNGTCLTLNDNQYTCLCPNGYAGQACEVPDPCRAGLNTCKNGGNCTSAYNAPSNTFSYKCSCAENFYGKNCTLSNPCTTGALSCVNGGTCQASFNTTSQLWNPKCKCTGVWGGQFCEVVDPCLAGQNPCQNNGTCLSVFNELTKRWTIGCSCTAAWKDPICTTWQDPCLQPGSCPAHSTCGGQAFNSGKWNCTCAQFYGGADCHPICQLPPPTVTVLNATSGATLSVDNTPVGFNATTCACEGDYYSSVYGHRTQYFVSTPHCDSRCGAANATYSDDTMDCTCNSAHTGANCDVPVCDSLDSNLNLTTCTCVNNTYDLYYGRASQAGVVKARCASRCYLGTLVPTDHTIGNVLSYQPSNITTPPVINITYSCACSDGWAGPNCDIWIDPCVSVPCLNGGTCSSAFGVTGHFCTCPTSYIGANCQTHFDACAADVHCQNGGTCVDHGYGHNTTCVCPTGFVDDRCTVFGITLVTSMNFTNMPPEIFSFVIATIQHELQAPLGLLSTQLVYASIVNDTAIAINITAPDPAKYLPIIQAAITANAYNGTLYCKYIVSGFGTGGSYTPPPAAAAATPVISTPLAVIIGSAGAILLASIFWLYSAGYLSGGFVQYPSAEKKTS
jgi:hypothetical protein